MLFVIGCPAPEAEPGRVELHSDGWVIVGNISKPESAARIPAVLLLHMMPTDRSSYDRLAGLLAERGVASLRIDLRGHGESTNLGSHNQEINSQAWRDILAAVSYLQGLEGIDPRRIGVLGASYSGEQAARAAREGAEIRAFVIMSSGSFSDESISFVADSEYPWWFIAAEDDANPSEAMKKAAASSELTELTVFESGGHGTYLFSTRNELEEMIAGWFAEKLRRQN